MYYFLYYMVSINSYLVRIQVLTVANMKMTLVWDVAPCSLVEIYWRFRGDYIRPDDGDSKHLWNVVKLLPDHTA
jgi:hypothetical protein